MTDSEAIASLEEAGFSSWPAEREWRDGGFVVRLSPNLPYKRCSSLNFSSQAPADIAAALARARRAFEEAGVPFCVRQTPLAPPALLARLDAQGWPSSGRSHVMTLALAGPGGAQDEAVSVSAEPEPAWLDAYASLSRALRQKAAFAGVLGRIRPPVRYLSIRAGGRIVAVGVMVRDGDRAGLFGIATDPAARRRGFAGRLSRHALALACEAGARLGWLQVEAANVPAIALYRKIGFTTAYSYCYRTPPEAR